MLKQQPDAPTLNVYAPRRQPKPAACGLIISPPPANTALPQQHLGRHFYAARSPLLTPITGSSTCSIPSRDATGASEPHRSFELELQIAEEQEDCIFSSDSPYSSLQSARFDKTTFDRPKWQNVASLSASDSSAACSPTLGAFPQEVSNDTAYPDSPTVDFAALHKEFAVASPSQSELGITESPAKRKSQQYGDIFISLHPEAGPTTPLRKAAQRIKRQSPLSLSHVPILLDERISPIRARQSPASPVSPSPLSTRSKHSPASMTPPPASALSEFANRALPSVPGGRPYKPVDLFGAKQALQHETEELDLSFAEMPVSYRRPSLPTKQQAEPVTLHSRRASAGAPVLFAAPLRTPLAARDVSTERVTYVSKDNKPAVRPPRMYDMI